MPHTPTSKHDVLQLLRDLIEQFSLLKDLLLQEKTSLSSGDIEVLGDLLTPKTLVSSEIQRLEGKLAPCLASGTDLPPGGESESQLKQWIAAQSEAVRRKLEPVHTELKNVMFECRQLNAVNGKIVHRSQQSVAELMKIINGTASDSLYTSQGTARISGEGTTLAQA